MVAEFETELVRRFVEELGAQRQLLSNALKDSWADVEEANFVQSNTILVLKAQSDNEEMIDSILAFAGVAAGNAGLVELGDADKPHQIVVTPGSTQQFDTRIRLKNTSTRRITSVTFAGNTPGQPQSGPAGFLYLALFGKEVPIGALRW